MDSLLSQLSVPRLAPQENAGLGPPAKRWRTTAGESLDFSDAQKNGDGGTGTVRRKANQRISVQLRVARYSKDSKTDWTMNIDRGNLIFVLQHTLTTPTGNGEGGSPQYTWHRGSATPAAVLHVLNYLCARLKGLTNNSMPNGPTPGWLVQNVRLIGAVTTANANIEYTAPYGASPELAVDVQNMNTQVTDCFAPFVKFMDKLWLIAEERMVGRVEMFLTRSRTRQMDRVEMRTASGERIKSCTRIVPYVSGYDYVPATRLMTPIQEDDGVPLLVAAHPIRVGTVFEGLRSAHMAPDAFDMLGSYYDDSEALPHADAAVDAVKAYDYGFIDVIMDPAQ